MEEEPKFVYFKKLLIFGAEGSGKSTLSLILEKKEFIDEEVETVNKEGKYKNNIIFF